MPYKIYCSGKGDASVLQRGDYEIAAPAAHEVQIEHAAVGLNFIDIYFRTGLYPWPPQAQELVLGSEAAGTVSAVGSAVTDLRPGDRVTYTVGNGAYCSHRNVDAKYVIKLPGNVSFEQAAAGLLKGLTAYYLLHNSFPAQRAERVLFHAAAGGVGLIAGQWLRHLGVASIGTAGSAAKCDLARAHGFDEVINYNEADFAAEVTRLTSGRGVEVVYDSVGNSTMAGSLRCLRAHGTLVSFGQSSGPYLDFKVNDLAAGCHYLTRPTLRLFVEDRAWLLKASEALFALVGSGVVQLTINQRYPLAEVAEAQRQLEARATTGSTVLLV